MDVSYNLFNDQPLAEEHIMNHIELIEGTRYKAGGYSVNGQEFASDEAEALVDEARMIACATGRSIVEVLASIIPA